MKAHPALWNPARAHALVSARRDQEGGLLPALQDLQAEFGFVPDPAIALVAEIFNISRADVFGVVTFYHDLRTTPPAARHVLKLCRAEACQAAGGDALAENVQLRLGAKWNETTKDGRISVEPVFCLGLCACGPSGMIDGEPVARLTPEKVGRLLDGLD